MAPTRFLHPVAFLLLAAGLAAPIVISSRVDSAASEVADLKDQLKNGLLARRPEDRAFLDRVVQMVEEDRLPIDLVKGTFHWARRKKPYPYNAFPYFERALRTRAAELGIKIE
jgi:hypothetical protein